MRNAMIAETVDFIRALYPGRTTVSLHEPVLGDLEQRYVRECIDSTFVSSIGPFVTRFERVVAERCGVPHAVATASGTAALHLALLVCGVRPGDEVITQATTFVATCNAIAYCGARPYFVDADRSRLSLSATRLADFLDANAERDQNGTCRNRQTGAAIRACVPMHTFGHPADVTAIAETCERWNVALIEDAAESLGSSSGGRMTGGFGRMAILSFNGNKIVTTGGGGMVLARDEDDAREVRHLSTTAKCDHAWDYVHDRVGFNYRMPNLNAALGCAQMERLEDFMADKRDTAGRYRQFFRARGIETIEEPSGCRSNYWLCGILLGSAEERDEFLAGTNEAGIRTRPLWRLMPDLVMYRDAQHRGLEVSRWLSERVVNLPSGVRS